MHIAHGQQLAEYRSLL